MTTEAHRALERWISLLEEFQNAIALLLNYGRNVFTISTLIEEYVHCQIRNEIPDRGDAIKRNIIQSGIGTVVMRVRIGQIKFFTILPNSSVGKIKEVSPTAKSN
jgi:hypothetical protein